MIDVDFFKKYNDTYGHAAGDDCLKAICQAILAISSRRSSDLAARYGGEEIAVILPDTDVAGAAIVAEAIRQAVAELKIPHVHNIGGYVTVSAGIAAFSPQPDTDGPTLLIKAADKALYKAKAEGRNTVSYETHGR
jgi:diguanylate cyclase (GGDEF)-like protein